MAQFKRFLRTIFARIIESSFRTEWVESECVIEPLYFLEVLEKNPNLFKVPMIAQIFCGGENIIF